MSERVFDLKILRYLYINVVIIGNLAFVQDGMSAGMFFIWVTES